MNGADGLEGYRTTRSCLAAHNFTMPALSPTMTEGNIAKWNVKEGDSFVAGDVLLEIETDKASMDVEAQDDGIMAKIVMPDGSKGIKVGARIGVLAEEGDDISSLEIPAEESAPAPPPKEEKKQPEQPKKTEPAKETSAGSQSPETKSAQKTAPQKSKDVAPTGKKMNKAYPMLPSVEHLIKEKKISKEDLENIEPTGPKGQLLKGDILAYLGKVAKDVPGELAARFQHLSHLDLSNIKVSPKKEAPKVESAKEETAAEAKKELEIIQVALPISMANAIEVQKRIESTLGVFMPLSTFIARASDVANDDLPRSKTTKPTADELFNDVLGLNNVHSNFGVRGNFLPQIQALPATAMATVPRVRKVEQKVDVLDFLTGKVRNSAPRRVAPTPVQGPPGTTSIFSVLVPKGDERQGKVFLENLKEILEEEPGRLVL